MSRWARAIFYGIFALDAVIWGVIAAYQGHTLSVLALRFGYYKLRGFIILGVIPCVAFGSSLALPLWLYRRGQIGLALTSIALLLVLYRVYLWYPKVL
jgi:hypothetical protein